jgi:tetratricopeptide (TPR) repeat protein
MDKFLQFLKDNKDALGWLFGSGVFLVVARFVVWLLKEYRLRKIRSNDNFPFKIIPPNSNVAKEILGGADDDPLADRNIPYQQRIQGRNTRRELEELIEDNRWILIAGRTGLGKTREAVQLAQSLSNEGWTTLYLTRETWLDAPAKLPTNVPERKLLFFLDDLNKKCHSSKAEIRPGADESLTLPIYEPFQTRLQRTFEAFDTFCGKSEIRVIATARNEKSSEFDEPSEWEKLGWTRFGNLWENFKLFDLPEPDEKTEQQLLIETAAKANIYINSYELPTIARRNDGTFRNLVENLSTAKSEGLKLSTENFRDTLKGTWQKRYQKAIQKYPEAIFIYDAIEAINITGIELKFKNVLNIATIMAPEKRRGKLGFRSKCYLALKQLEKSENILSPRDGQIEAKGYRIVLKDYIRKLYFQLTQKHFATQPVFVKLQQLSWILLCPSKYFLDSKIDFTLFFINNFIFASTTFNNVGYAFFDLGYIDDALFYYEKSINLKQREIGNLFQKKSLAITLANKGRALFFSKRHEEAISACKKAIELDKKQYFAWKTLGDIYFETKDYENARSAYNTAIQGKPRWPSPRVSLGYLLANIEKYDDAIAVLQKATTVNNKWATPWNALGYVYMRLARYDEAINVFQRAISIAPNWTLPWNNISFAYSNMRQIDDAIVACQKAIAISPKSTTSWINLAKVYADSKRHNEAKSACEKAEELAPKDAFSWEKLGHIYRRIALLDNAIHAYKKAIELNPKIAYTWYSLGIGYRRLGHHNDALYAFQKAVELDPKEPRSWNGIGSTYSRMRLYDDAFVAYQKVIGLDSKNPASWHGIGQIYAKKKDNEKALQAYKNAVEFLPENTRYRASLIVMLGNLKRNAEALEQEKIARSFLDKENEYNRACFESICGNIEEALYLLKTALEQKQENIEEWILQDSAFDSIRDDPRFQVLVGLK